VAATTSTPGRLPSEPPEDPWPTYIPDLADDPWLAEDPGPPPPWPADDASGPPPWLAGYPGPDDPEDITAWLDAELAKAAPWLAGDPYWDDSAPPSPPGPRTPGPPGPQTPGPPGPRTPGSPGPRTPVEVFKAGRWDRSRGDGGGFAAGGLADHLPPGPVLAGLAGDRWQAGLGRLSDDELIGILRAARRLASWATAMELAAAGDLWRRRTAEEDAGDAGAALYADAEIATALTLTGRAATGVLELAVALRRLPATRAALAAGDIDLQRATVIADEVTGLTDEHAAAVDQAVAAAAPGQTTGQLRRATHRAMLAADPAAARTRKEQALREARVERWTEPAGTATLAGRDLPPAAVLAADANLTALARQLKAAGGVGTLDTLRAQIYLALLTGAPVSSLLPADGGSGNRSGGRNRPAGDGCAGSGPANGGGATPGSPSAPPGSSSAPPGSPSAASGSSSAVTGSPSAASGFPWLGVFGPAGIAGSVNLTLPLATWLGQCDDPGHAAGYGPLDATDSRTLANALAAQVGTRWCLTLTGPDGRPVAHGCARTGSPAARRSRPRAGPETSPHADARAGPTTDTDTPGEPGTGLPRRPQSGFRGRPYTHPPQRTWTFTLSPLTSGKCDHGWETPAYRPSAALRHRVQIRHATCVFPGCRRPAAQCDADHTLAYHHGGKTCLCNLAPLCRRHHEVKQTPGWSLEQTSPGTLTWITASGRRYITTPTNYLQ
jgi:Domain of unknown function (DUF222)